MDFTTFLVGLAIVLGLIGSDAYWNANTLYFDASVSKELIDQGYSEDVVVDRVVNQIKRMSNNRSLVSPRTFRSTSSKSFAVELAEAINVDKAMIALQDLLGYVPPRMLATVVGKDKDVKVVVSGYSEDSGFLLTSVDGSADDMERIFFSRGMEYHPQGRPLYRNPAPCWSVRQGRYVWRGEQVDRGGRGGTAGDTSKYKASASGAFCAGLSRCWMAT